MIRRLVRKYGYVVAPFLLVIGVSGVVVHKQCVDRQDDRQVLRQVVIVSTTSASSSLDLTRIPGFDRLDETTKTFVRNLSAAIAASSPSTRKALQDELLGQLPTIDCFP